MSVTVASEAGWDEGVRLFEVGEYWEAHEALEPLWLDAQDLEKHFYGGVILLAAALHKARQMGSARGGAAQLRQSAHSLSASARCLPGRSGAGPRGPSSRSVTRSNP